MPNCYEVGIARESGTLSVCAWAYLCSVRCERRKARGQPERHAEKLRTHVWQRAGENVVQPTRCDSNRVVGIEIGRAHV